MAVSNSSIPNARCYLQNNYCVLKNDNFYVIAKRKWLLTQKLKCCANSFPTTPSFTQKEWYLQNHYFPSKNKVTIIYSRFLVASSLTKSLAATPYPNDLFYLQFRKSDLKFYYLTLPYTNSKSYLEKTLPHKYSLKHIRTKYVQTAARIFHPMSGQEIMHSRCRTSTNKP